jgi:hypothetical protein
MGHELGDFNVRANQEFLRKLVVILAGKVKPDGDPKPLVDLLNNVTRNGELLAAKSGYMLGVARGLKRAMQSSVEGQKRKVVVKRPGADDFSALVPAHVHAGRAAARSAAGVGAAVTARRVTPGHWAEPSDRGSVRDAIGDGVGETHAMSEAGWRRPVAGFTYTIENDLVRMTVPSAPTPAAFEATLQRVLIDPRFRRGMAILYDRRAAVAPTPQYLAAVMALTHQYAELLGRCRWAVLVRDDDGETFSLVRNHAPEMAPSSEPWSFTDVGQALEWLRS